MIDSLSGPQLSKLNQMNRGFSTVYSGGFGQFVADILDTLSQGTVGCTSAGIDIDSLCLGGGAFTYDPDSSSGLNFVYDAGRILIGDTVTSVSGGTLSLGASATNYIEVASNGTVSSNTSGFTAGRFPLYSVVTGSASITSVTNVKALLTWTPPASITGASLSAEAAARLVQVPLGTLTTTTSYLAIAPCTGTLTAASLVSPLAVTSSDTNYWTVSITNLGAAGAGTEAMLAATAANTTKATGGHSLAVNVPQALTASGTVSTSAGDVLKITAAATGSPTPLTGGVASMTFAFTD